MILGSFSVGVLALLTDATSAIFFAASKDVGYGYQFDYYAYYFAYMLAGSCGEEETVAVLLEVLLLRLLVVMVFVVLCYGEEEETIAVADDKLL